jgi:hypothetical protein
MYQHPKLQFTLPPLHLSCSNDSGNLRSTSGWPLPPFLALERGVSLRQWLCLDRSPLAILHMFYDLAQQLARVHAAGICHRDLKPGAMQYFSNFAWKQLTHHSTHVAARRCTCVPAASRAGKMCTLQRTRAAHRKYSSYCDENKLCRERSVDVTHPGELLCRCCDAVVHGMLLSGL